MRWGIQRQTPSERQSVPLCVTIARMSPLALNSPSPLRVLMLGATGTIGRATVRALLQRGHAVVGLVRPGTLAHAQNTLSEQLTPEWLQHLTLRECSLIDPDAIAAIGLQGESFDAVVSCLASRSGTPTDAWAIDHAAHLNVLHAVQRTGVRQFVLLSAICVQKPRLAFQHAKLAFEQALIESGLNYSIVRPTAFFKSLSGQIDRVRRGKPFLVFGNGRLTACKPISDTDLADFLAGCLSDVTRHNRVLPVGGPGPALTPLDQVRLLSQALGREVPVRHVPLGLMGAIVATLSLMGHLVPGLRAKAELARIGRYYASESMLVLNPVTGLYDEKATPSWGTQTLSEHYASVIQNGQSVDLGEHGLF
jgi:divinyl chlorophyllide a 8-vinyl-reductase